MNDVEQPPALSAHKQRIRAVAFSPDGTLLATAGEDQNVLIWDKNQVQPLATLTIRGSKIMAIAWCGPAIVAAGGSDNLIHMLDINTREEVAVLTGHTGTIAALAADPAGRMLISGSFDTTARVWNIEQIVAGKTTAQNAPTAPLTPPVAPAVTSPVTQAPPLTLPSNPNPHTSAKPGVTPTPAPSLYK